MSWVPRATVQLVPEWTATLPPRMTLGSSSSRPGQIFFYYNSMSYNNASIFPLLFRQLRFLLHTSDSHGECNGTPLWYSCLENPMDGGAW